MTFPHCFHPINKSSVTTESLHSSFKFAMVKYYSISVIEREMVVLADMGAIATGGQQAPP